MLNFEDVLSYYPPALHGFKENILKEYLQYKILDIIFKSKFSERLIFMGGTAIRIVHNSTRFSEDLDFDNIGLDEQGFNEIANIIEHGLKQEGYQVEIKNSFQNAFHCYIKFPGLLYDHQLSGDQQEKILIRLDTESQDYRYKPEKFLLNKFGLFRYIQTVSMQLLLSQKILACLKRPREKGRDFYDVVFLAAKTKPDFDYLKSKVAINNQSELVAALKEKTTSLNFKQLAQDVEPFLFDADQKDRVLYFKDWLGSVTWQ